MVIPEGFRRILPHRAIVANGPPYRFCRACSCNTVLHHLSEKPWECGYCGECPGLETAELDAMIAAFLARPGRQQRPWIPLAVRQAALERDGMICRYCGRRVHRRKTGPGQLHFDHVIPCALGGPSTLENIVVSCRTCNLDKKDRMVDAWLADLEEMAEFETYSGLRLAKIRATLSAADPAA
jgi:5-methylcytosine-specific restriction endonuclease McrA